MRNIKKYLVLASMMLITIIPTYAIEDNIISDTIDISPVGGSVTLNFDSNGGKEDTTMKLGVGVAPQIYELPIPEKVGYNFDGWYTIDGLLITGENVYDAFDLVVSGQEATVTAKWIEDEVLNAASSITIEPIENSEEYYEITDSVVNYKNGTSLRTITKNRMIEEYIIESFVTKEYRYTDGTITNEGLGVYNGYDEYNRNKAKNSLDIEVIDNMGNPISGVVINFKTDEEDINFTTDEEGKISHQFNRTLKYTTTLISLPDGYELSQEPLKLGLGCMYSVIYQETYYLNKIEDTTIPSEEDTTTPSEENTTTPSEEDTTTPSEENTTTPSEEDTTTSSEENTTTSSEENTTTPSEENTTTPSEENTTTPSEENTTTPSEENTTTPNEENTTTPSEENMDTPQTSDNLNLLYYVFICCTTIILSIFIVLKKD